MVKINEDATVAFYTPHVDKYILNTDISVQDTSYVVDIAMSYRADKAQLSREKARSYAPRTAS